VLAVAERYAPGGITNMLSVGGSQQVLLQVRFAEVARNAAKDLSSNFSLTYRSGNDLGSIDSGVPGTLSPFGTVTGRLISGNFDLQASIDALEMKGLLRTLAEPNLVALSGDTASFLAGGQIPIPVAQSVAPSGVGSNTAAITVQFKDFGIGLSFTPTVIGKELINLELNSEVSTLDASIAVGPYPGLKVRRAKTTVEMRDGQSFSIAGLLADDYQNGVSQFPVLGNIPILGALFRSTNFQHKQTELVILITARLVDPGIATNLASPTSPVVIPSDLSLFGYGNIEGYPPGGPPANAPKANPSSGFVVP
jgi:pilus assembly protein CpaC